LSGGRLAGAFDCGRRRCGGRFLPCGKNLDLRGRRSRGRNHRE
jgi:hypothetical protein